MSDDVGGRDEPPWARRSVFMRDLPVPTRCWTDADWTTIRQWSESDNVSSWRGVITTDQRLLLYRRPHMRAEFEAQFTRGDDGWRITALAFYQNPALYYKQDEVVAFAESLIESIARGDEDLPVREWLTQKEVFRKRHAAPVDDLNFPASTDEPASNGSSTARLPERVSQASQRGAPTTHTGGTVSACLLCQYKIPLLDAPLGPAGSPVGLCQQCNSLSCGWHGTLTPPPAFLCVLCDSTALVASAAWEKFTKADGLKRLPSRRGQSAAPGARDGRAAETTDEEAAKQLTRALASLFSTADGYPSPFVVASLEQWLDERPSYRKFMGVLTDDSHWAVREIDTHLRSSSKAMALDPTLGTPGTVARGPGHYGIGPIRSLWNGLDADGRRLLATAALLMVVLKVPDDLMPPPVADIATVIGDILLRDQNRIGTIRSRITAQQ